MTVKCFFITLRNNEHIVYYNNTFRDYRNSLFINKPCFLSVEFIYYQHYIWAYNYKYKLRSIQKYREYGPWSCIICRMWKTYIYRYI